MKIRIIEYGQKPADQFMANPKNPKFHPEEQRQALAGALNELGFIAPVIENARTGYLVDGHERVMQALLNNDDVPFVSVDLSEDEEDYALATFDPIGHMARHDRDKLETLLHDVQTGEAGVQAMLSELATKNGLYDMPVPSLDELEAEYGDHDETKFHPVIRVQVSPDTYARYQDVIKTCGGETDAGFSALLDAAEEVLNIETLSG